MINQFGLSVDPDVVANELDSYNAAIAKANGWTEFYAEDDAPVPFPPQRYQPAGAVAAHVRNTAVGIGAFSEWLGKGLIPTDKIRAEARAAVCTNCSQNVDPDFAQKLNDAAAKLFKGLIETKHEMKLYTDYDDKLNECAACACWLRLKVWVPPEIVQNRTSDKLRAELKEKAPACWILSESEIVKPERL